MARKFNKSTSKSPPTSSKSGKSNLTPVVIYWHRTDLRLHDSPALQHALSLNPSTFIPLWTWDPHYVFRSRVGPNRWKFLVECQHDLSSAYTRLNARQKLWVIREAPQTVFPKLFRKWSVTDLVFEKDTDAYARMRDEYVTRLAEEAGVRVHVRCGRTLFDPDELVKCNGGKPTMSMGQTQKAAQKLNDGKPARPFSPPEHIPNPPKDAEMAMDAFQHGLPMDWMKGRDMNATIRQNASQGSEHYKFVAGPKGDYAIPTLEEMGIDPARATTPHQGGESIALRMLDEYIQDEEYTGTFAKPASSPAAFDPPSTTLLSPHLHFGSLGVRKFWWDVQGVIERRRKARKRVSDEPVNLPGQLLFRDMYFGAQAALGVKFARAHGNPVARWVDWHLLSKYEGGEENGNVETTADGQYTVDNPQAEIWFQRWKHGRTGFPWIDALMRQLRQEGWIHHLGRHSVACFLTRGGCYVSWERGAEVFEEWLLDHEPACNLGNWMWLSCTAFFSQFHRCYSPIAFGRKWDPAGDFVRRYVPELRDFDAKYIYEPWKAPVADQKRWGCLVKWDDVPDEEGEKEETGTVSYYPKPMFDFDQRRRFCMDGMKRAYDVGLYGDDEKVLNGTWKEIFGVQDQGESHVHRVTAPGRKKRKLDEGVEEEDGIAESGDGNNDVTEHTEKTKVKKKNEEKAADKEAQKSRKRQGDRKTQGTLDRHWGKKKKE